MHSVELPDHVYEIARKAAETEGMTLEDWISAAVSTAGVSQSPDEIRPRTLEDLLGDLIGSFDSSGQAAPDRPISPMAELVADKLQKQGIEVPWRRQP